MMYPKRISTAAAMVRKLGQYFLIWALFSCEISALCPSQCNCDNDKLRVGCKDLPMFNIPFTLNPHITALSAINVSLNNLEASLQFYPKLAYLDLSSNDLKELTPVNFDKQKGLVTLDLSRNHLHSIAPYTFKELASLQSLDLSHNSLESLDNTALVGLESLQALNLSSNNILDIESRAVIGACPVLKTLDISSNLMTKFYLLMPKFLVTLNLSNNAYLKSFVTGSYSLPVSVLDLRNTKALNPCPALTAAAYLKTLIHSSLLSLACPGVSFQIENLVITNDDSLHILTNDHLQNFKDLKAISISQCINFKAISPNAFQTYNVLERITLDSNSGLSYLSLQAFHSLPSLKVLSLANNSLTNIEKDNFDNKDVVILASGNPFQCTCMTQKLRLPLFECSSDERGKIESDSSHSINNCHHHYIIDKRITIGSVALVVLVTLSALCGLVLYRAGGSLPAFKVRGSGHHLPHCHISVQSLMMSNSGSFTSKSQDQFPARLPPDPHIGNPDDFEEIDLSVEYRHEPFERPVISNIQPYPYMVTNDGVTQTYSHYNLQYCDK